MYKTYLEKLEEITSKAKGVELEETVKVELGINKDVDKLFNEGKNIVKEFKEIRKKLSDIAVKKNKELLKYTKKADKLKSLIETQAKELGVKTKDIEAYQDIDFSVNKVRDVQNAYARMSSRIIQEKI